MIILKGRGLRNSNHAATLALNDVRVLSTYWLIQDNQEWAGHIKLRSASAVQISD